MVNYGVVLLLGVVSLMTGSTTGVPMSLGYGGYQSTTYDAPAYFSEAPKYYTTKASENYTTTYAAPAYYTEASKYYSAPSYYTEAPTYYTTTAAEYYTEPTKYYTTKVPEYYTTTYAAPTYFTDAPKYYSVPSCVELFLSVCYLVLIVLKNMASTESDTRTSQEDSIRSPKFDDDDSPEHSERKRPLDGDSDLSDRKTSHFTGGE
jgi:hypothetical protein